MAGEQLPQQTPEDLDSLRLEDFMRTNPSVAGGVLVAGSETPTTRALKDISLGMAPASEHISQALELGDIERASSVSNQSQNS